MTVKAIVLAAGKGKRMQSEQMNMPKAMRSICGKPLLIHVLDSISFIHEEDICIVVGYGKEMILRSINGGYVFAHQDEQLGTGHAVMMAADYFSNYDGDVLVLYGDMPLVKKETYLGIMERHAAAHAACTITTVKIHKDPPDFGRIIRDAGGNISGIVEKRDCTPEQLGIPEMNVGIYAFDSMLLFENLRYITDNNNQHEYYLTDVPKVMLKNGCVIQSYEIADTAEAYGVNTPEELQICESILSKRNIRY